MQLMRTLGPGSISSLLKIILDVVYVALWIGIGAVGLGALSALLLSFDPDLLGSFTMNFNGDKLVRKWPAIIALLITVSFYLAGILVIVSRLRRIFATLMASRHRNNNSPCPTFIRNAEFDLPLATSGAS